MSPVSSRCPMLWRGQYIFSSVQLLTCVRLCDPMDCSMPGFPAHHQFPELTQTHVHWVGMPSNHLILCRLLLLPPSIKIEASGSFQMSHLDSVKSDTCSNTQWEASSAAIHGVAKSRTRLSDWTELNWDRPLVSYFSLGGQIFPSYMSFSRFIRDLKNFVDRILKSFGTK